MQEILIKTQEYIKSILKDEFTGHDYYHAIRVKNVANNILQKEGGNKFVVKFKLLEIYEELKHKIK